MHDLEDVSDLGDLEDEEDQVFLPLRPNDRSADYYEETQRSFQELRLQREEASVLARKAMDRELEKLHRMFFRQDFMGTRGRHQRRHRRRPAVSDTSSSSDTDCLDTRRTMPLKPRSFTPGPRLEGPRHQTDTDDPRSDRSSRSDRDSSSKDKARFPQDGARSRKRMCKESKSEPHSSHTWTTARAQHCGAVSG